MPPSAVVTASETVPVPPVAVSSIVMVSVEVKPCCEVTQVSESVLPLHISVQPCRTPWAPTPPSGG